MYQLACWCGAFPNFTVLSVYDCKVSTEVIAKPHFILVFSLIFFDFHIILDSFAIGSTVISLFQQLIANPE